MASRTSELIANLVDNVSKPARGIAAALKQAEAQVKSIGASMASTGVAGSDKLVASLAKLKLTKTDIEAVSVAWKQYATAQGLAADASQWTKTQAAEVAAWERQTVASIRTVIAERRAEAAATANVVREQQMLMRRQAEAQAAMRRQWLGGGGNAMMAAQFGAMAAGGGILAATKNMY